MYDGVYYKKDINKRRIYVPTLLSRWRNSMVKNGETLRHEVRTKYKPVCARIKTKLIFSFVCKQRDSSVFKFKHKTVVFKDNVQVNKDYIKYKLFFLTKMGSTSPFWCLTCWKKISCKPLGVSPRSKEEENNWWDYQDQPERFQDIQSREMMPSPRAFRTKNWE